LFPLRRFNAMPLGSRKIWDIGLLGLLLLTGVFVVRTWRDADPSKPEDRPESMADVDLLKLIDPATDAGVGSWSKENGSLVTSSVPFGRLEIPYIPPPEYELRATVQRRQGTDSLNIGLAQGKHQVVAIFDGTQTGDFAGLEMINMKGFMDNPTTVHEKLLPPGQARTIVFTVREKQLTVAVDGRKIIDWPANYEQTAVYKDWRVNHPDTLFVGSYASEFRIDELILHPFKAGGRRTR
jgi:hypothetical protein